MAGGCHDAKEGVTTRRSLGASLDCTVERDRQFAARQGRARMLAQSWLAGGVPSGGVVAWAARAETRAACPPASNGRFDCLQAGTPLALPGWNAAVVRSAISAAESRLFPGARVAHCRGLRAELCLLLTSRSHLRESSIVAAMCTVVGPDPDRSKTRRLCDAAAFDALLHS